MADPVTPTGQFDEAFFSIWQGYPSQAQESLKDVSTEDLVRLHRAVRVSAGVIESIVIARVGAGPAAMLLAAKG